MFGLPFTTTLLVFGFPAFWIAYTIGFLILSRDWVNDTQHEQKRPSEKEAP
jgi:hypothetical protein